MHVLNLLILLVKLALHLSYLLQSLLLVLSFQITVHILSIDVLSDSIHLLFHDFFLGFYGTGSRSALLSVLVYQRIGDDHMITDDYVLIELHRPAMKIFLQTFLDILTVLLYVSLQEIRCFVELNFQVALDDLINLPTVQPIE